MRVSVVKYLYWEEHYTIRECAIIVGYTEDYVRKVIQGKRAIDCAPSYEEMTEEMLKRKEIIDRIVGLRGAYFITGSQKYNYISLLAYLGYTVHELSIIFPTDKLSFLSVSALRSGKAWKEFDSEILGISKEDFAATFLEERTIPKEKKKEEDAVNYELLEWKRKNRREAKKANMAKMRKN